MAEHKPYSFCSLFNDVLEALSNNITSMESQLNREEIDSDLTEILTALAETKTTLTPVNAHKDIPCKKILKHGYLTKTEKASIHTKIAETLIENGNIGKEALLGIETFFTGQSKVYSTVHCIEVLLLQSHLNQRIHHTMRTAKSAFILISSFLAKHPEKRNLNNLIWRIEEFYNQLIHLQKMPAHLINPDVEITSAQGLTIFPRLKKQISELLRFPQVPKESWIIDLLELSCFPVGIDAEKQKKSAEIINAMQKSWERYQEQTTESTTTQASKTLRQLKKSVGLTQQTLAQSILPEQPGESHPFFEHSTLVPDERHLSQKAYKLFEFIGVPPQKISQVKKAKRRLGNKLKAQLQKESDACAEKYDKEIELLEKKKTQMLQTLGDKISQQQEKLIREGSQESTPAQATAIYANKRKKHFLEKKAAEIAKEHAPEKERIIETMTAEIEQRMQQENVDLALYEQLLMVPKQIENYAMCKYHASNPELSLQQATLKLAQKIQESTIFSDDAITIITQKAPEEWEAIRTLTSAYYKKHQQIQKNASNNPASSKEDLRKQPDPIELANLVTTGSFIKQCLTVIQNILLIFTKHHNCYAEFSELPEDALQGISRNIDQLKTIAQECPRTDIDICIHAVNNLPSIRSHPYIELTQQLKQALSNRASLSLYERKEQGNRRSGLNHSGSAQEENDDETIELHADIEEITAIVKEVHSASQYKMNLLTSKQELEKTLTDCLSRLTESAFQTTLYNYPTSTMLLTLAEQIKSSIPQQKEHPGDFQEILKSLQESHILKELGNRSRPLTIYTSKENHKAFLLELSFFVNAKLRDATPATNNKVKNITRKLSLKTTSRSHQVSLNEVKNDVNGNITESDLNTLEPYPSIDSLMARHSRQMKALKTLKIRIMEERPEIFSQINRYHPFVTQKLLLAEHHQQQLIQHLHLLINSTPKKRQNHLALMMQLELLQTMHEALIQETANMYQSGNIDAYLIKKLSSLLSLATKLITSNQDLNQVFSFTPDYPDLLWKTFYEKPSSITAVNEHILSITHRKLKAVKQAFSINWVDWVLDKLNNHLTDISDTASQIEQKFKQKELNSGEKSLLTAFQETISNFISTGSKESFYRINARELVHKASIDSRDQMGRFIEENHATWIRSIITIEEYLDNEQYIYKQLQKLFKRISSLCTPSLPSNKRMHLSTVRNKENTLEIHIVEPLRLVVPEEKQSFTIDISQTAHQEGLLQQLQALTPETHIHFKNSNSPDISSSFIDEALKNLPKQAVLHLDNSMPKELILLIADVTLNVFGDSYPTYKATNHTPELYLFLDSISPKDHDAAYSLFLEVTAKKSDKCHLVFKDSVYTPILQHGSTKGIIEKFQDPVKDIRELSLCTTYSDLIGYMTKSKLDIYRRVEDDQLHMAIQIPKKYEQEAIRLCKALCPDFPQTPATTIVEKESLEHEQYKSSELRKLLTTVINPSLPRSRQLLLSTVHDDQLKLKIEKPQEEIISGEEHPLTIDISQTKLSESLKAQIQALPQKSHIHFTHDSDTEISYNLITKVIHALPKQAVLHLDEEMSEEVIPIIAKAVFDIYGEAQPPHTATNNTTIYLSLKSNETTHSLAYLAQIVEQSITSDPKKITLYHTDPPGNSKDSLYIPYQTSDETPITVSILPHSLLPSLKTETDKNTRALKTRDGKTDQSFRTYPTQDLPINPFTRLPVSSLYTSQLSLSSRSLFRVTRNAGSRGGDKETHIEDWAGILENGVDLKWHVDNAKIHISSDGSERKIDEIYSIMGNILKSSPPVNRKIWLSKLRTLVADLVETDEQQSLQEYTEFYIWPIVNELPHEKIQLKTFRQLKEAFEVYAEKKRNCQQSHVNYASHLLSGWGCTARPVEALTELSRATGISVNEVDKKAKTLIYHALFFEEVRFDPSTQMLALNTQSECSEAHILQEKLTETSIRLSGQQVNLQYSSTDLERIYNNGNGDLYAGILLSQIYLSGKFEQFDQTPIIDNEENREAGISILEKILEKSPKNKMANLLYGICLKKGIGTHPSPLKAMQHLSQIPFELPVDLTNMLSTDLLSWNLGALSYKMITNSEIKLDRLSFAEEVAQSIIRYKEPLSLNQTTLFEPDYSSEAFFAFLQIGPLFNIHGVSTICLKNNDLINRLTRALQSHYQDMLAHEEPFCILVKHSVFKEAFRKGMFCTSRLETSDQPSGKTL